MELTSKLSFRRDITGERF